MTTASEYLNLSGAEVGPIADDLSRTGRSVLTDPDRWGTEANPEGRIAIVGDDHDEVAIVSAEQTVFSGPLAPIHHYRAILHDFERV